MNSIKSPLDRPGTSQGTGSVNKDREELGLRHNSAAKRREIESSTKDHVKVDIESRVKDFARIKSAVDRVPETDHSDKIKSLKERILNRTYEINEGDIAEIMLKTEY